MSFIVLEGNEPPGNSEQAGRLEHLTRVECFHDDKTYGCRVWTLVAWDGERRVVHFDQDRKNNRTKFREFHEQVIAAGFQLTFLQAESIKTQIDYAKSPPEFITNEPLQSLQRAVTSEEVAEVLGKVKEAPRKVAGKVKDAVENVLEKVDVAEKWEDTKETVAHVVDVFKSWRRFL